MFVHHLLAPPSREVTPRPAADVCTTDALTTDVRP